MMMEMVIAKMLTQAGFEDVTIRRESVADVPEPVIVLGGTFEREERMEDCERGTYCLRVLVVRESAAEAYQVASNVEHVLRTSDWESASTESVLIACIDTQSPVFEKRDSSGRHICKVAVTVTATREI